MTITKPSFWYLAVSLLLGVTAYPSVVWLPSFVERFRHAGNGLLLLPSHLLFARGMGGLIAILSIVFLGLFILSSFKLALHDLSYFKACGLVLAIVYALSLMGILATVG